MVANPSSAMAQTPVSHPRRGDHDRHRRDDEHAGQRQGCDEPLQLRPLDPPSAAEADDHRDDPDDEEGDGRDLQQPRKAVRNREQRGRIVQGSPDVGITEVACEVRTEGGQHDGGERHDERDPDEATGSAAGQAPRGEDGREPVVDPEQRGERPRLGPDQDEGQAARQRGARPDVRAAESVGSARDREHEHDPKEQPPDRVPGPADREQRSDRAVECRHRQGHGRGRIGDETRARQDGRDGQDDRDDDALGAQGASAHAPIGRSLRVDRHAGILAGQRSEYVTTPPAFVRRGAFPAASRMVAVPSAPVGLARVGVEGEGRRVDAVAEARRVAGRRRRRARGGRRRSRTSPRSGS